MTPSDTYPKPFNRINGSAPFFLPNLTLWYDWHGKRGTLPAEWRGWSLPQIARDLGVPAWLAARPFRIESGDVEVQKVETSRERLVRYRTPAGDLTERWTLGPDGDWWQTEFAVKTAADLRVLLEIVSLRRYAVDTTELEQKTLEAGEDGIVALELPRRPFSQVFLEWLGWGDGLLLLFDARSLVEEIVGVLESKLQRLVEQAATLPNTFVVSPDNLDAQFISPRLFQRYLADSYRQSAGILSDSDKVLLVGTGGPIAKLLRPLTEAGVNGVEGISGPPQSDAGLAEARQLAGPEFTLWGGIPQDALLPDFDRDQFEALALQAVREARNDSRAVIGVADRVPVLADLDRLKTLPALIANALSAQ
ncbi:MAG: hypothetical protein KDI03_21980 [Anaerolineae bacterium]|nr:hypothetical protein [Anaerolineae bacterium]MCB0207307.1 hypothetical protein [Anaerolineae bacterium]